ncbi:MAG: hypothetical protein Kow0037_26570 [Calditrichia bacterium]
MFQRNTLVRIILFSLFLSLPLWSQNADRVREFLWKQPFDSLLKKFAEESVLLKDPGNAARREAARPYTTAPGYRVQVFAGKNGDAARQIAGQIRTVANDSVYILQENNLFRVQVGNFKDRMEALKMIDRLAYAGYSNAFVTSAVIHVPRHISPEKAPSSGESPEQYAVQLFVTGSPEKANILKNEIEAAIPFPVKIIHQADFFKIVAGPFPTDAEARNALRQLQESGFKDAWVTQIE